MSLININNAYLSFSDVPLLDYAQLHIERHERVCLVGRNGAGKSTLLKIINKDLSLDDGQIIWAKDIKVSRLQQDPLQDRVGTVFDFVSEGIEQQTELLKNYHQVLQLVEQQPTEENLARLSDMQQQLDHHNAWQLDNQINEVLSQFELDASAELSSLSGGWLRKAALAKALVSQPDMLLLDEPTNHMDTETINWLEQYLLNYKGTLIFISHDRSFIRKMATRIVDLDRGQLVSYPGDYERYLQEKEDALRVEALQQQEFDRKLAQEEIWIRQGIKARRTRNEGRVRALKALRQESANRRNVMGKAEIKIEQGLKSGKLVFELEAVNYQIDGKQFISDFNAQVLRGDKIALIGANGCGKSTLLKLMLQQLKPDSGKIYTGTNLEVAYFDQHRAQLDIDKTVIDNVAEGRQEITFSGHSRHVLSYLQDFLFAPKRAMTPVRALSGGERNRLLLAKLFVKPSNLLILDEPTNDLDIETLELLEERLAEYQGTVLLVSHDRQFVDNTVTQSWIFEGNGIISPYIGGYTDAMHQQINFNPLNGSGKLKQQDIKPNRTGKQLIENNSGRRTKKLSYQQKQELEQLPVRLEELEKEIDELQNQVNAPDFFNLPFEYTNNILAALTLKQKEIEALFFRWETLESLNENKT